MSKRRRNKKGKNKMTTYNSLVKSPVGNVNTNSSILIPPCHKLTEIYTNLFIGKFSQYTEMIVNKNVDVLIPLDSVGGDIWEKGFKGELLYIPIKDYSVLPRKTAEYFADMIIGKLKERKKVGMFCIGGHGRTGYMAAIILGKLGIKDPIAFLRKNYCEEAVESYEQIDEIADILNEPILKKYSPAKVWGTGTVYYGYHDDYYGKSWYKDYPTVAKEKTVPDKCCGDCYWWYPKKPGDFVGECLVKGDVRYEDDASCTLDFMSKDESTGGV